MKADDVDMNMGSSIVFYINFPRYQY